MKTKLLLLTLIIATQGCDRAPGTAPSPNVKENLTVQPYCAPQQNGRVVHMRVTAYANCYECCQPYFDGYTASGHKIEHGDRLVAAPPNIKFGTMISIPGYNNGKPVPVLDRGGSIKGMRLDVLMDSYDEAIQWGRKNLVVTIYE